MRTLVLHNPTAGRSYRDRSSLVALLERFGHEVTYCCSDDQSWASELDGCIDLLVAAGGDGTVAKVGREAVGRQIALAILPLGTANNIADALGVAGRSLDVLVAGWDRAERHRFDVGVARGGTSERLFMESVGIGVLARTIAAAEEDSSLDGIEDPDAKLAAARKLARGVLRNMSGVDCELSVDQRVLSGRYLLVEALNFGAAGPNVRLTPAARCDDGVIDVVVVREEHRESLVDHLTGPPRTGAPWLEVYRGRTVTLRGPAERLHIDDEIVRTQDADAFSFELSLIPGALTVLVPPTDGDDRP